MCAIGRRLRESVNRLAFELRGLAPTAAAVVADPQSAVVGILPRADINRRRVGGVHDNAVEHKPVVVAQLCQPMPVRAFIRGFVEPAVGRAQQQMLRLPRKRRKSARIPARRAHNSPRALRRKAHRAQQKQSDKISCAATPNRRLCFEHPASRSFWQKAPTHLIQDPRISLKNRQFCPQKAKRLTSLCTGQPQLFRKEDLRRLGSPTTSDRSSDHRSRPKTTHSQPEINPDHRLRIMGESVGGRKSVGNRGRFV